MSRGQEFNSGANRVPTPEGWFRARAATVITGQLRHELIAVPREHIVQDSHGGSEDHVIGYITHHESDSGKAGMRAYSLHTANGPRNVSVSKRAWLYVHRDPPQT